jgi:hypothetical protein
MDEITPEGVVSSALGGDDTTTEPQAMSRRVARSEVGSLTSE